MGASPQPRPQQQEKPGLSSPESGPQSSGARGPQSAERQRLSCVPFLVCKGWVPCPGQVTRAPSGTTRPEPAAFRDVPRHPAV